MHSILNKPEVKKIVDELMSKMTLAQKIGQMTQAERLSCTPTEARRYHLGSVMCSASSAPDKNTLQHWLDMADSYWLSSTSQAKGHQGIPLLFGIDAIHGHSNLKGATIFPHNIGLGAADDPALIKKIAIITRQEVLASGIDWIFAPNLAVAQNNHWGRFYESFSQTPSIATKYASNIISGLQNNVKHQGVVACVKHWIGDGATSYGIDQGNAKISWNELNNTHISPYIAALNSGAMTIMASFSSWNGSKCHGDKFLITDVLKNQLQFSGFVVSDMDGIDYLSDDFYLSVALGVNAGIDMFMLSGNWKQFIRHLHSHIELGTVTLSRINDAVRRILCVKVACGLLDAPMPSERPGANQPDVNSLKHKNVAREAVRKSLVLLKNEHKLLPLKHNARILVTGKNANNIGHQCGGFTLDWQGVSGNHDFPQATSIWQGIKAIAPNSVLKETLTNTKAKEHDVAIVIIGETPYAEGLGDIRNGDDLFIEAGSQINGQINVSQPYASSTELNKIHPEDLLTIKKLTSLGIPVVVILISGRTLIINAELKASSAFVAAWLPGSEGQGVSDVLFGKYNFQGKLSFEWPKTTAEKSSVLFPLGFGLHYPS
ncbi:MAG: glycoside hydrolase family 3 protein [Litorilituus sp.]|jgi:beta-glucosidase|nr:glycoside hydrolase family 3 protein [Litorilituus sp.]